MSTPRLAILPDLLEEHWPSMDLCCDMLAEQLRANLQKRKAQLRSRRTGEADQRPDGLAASKELQKD